MGATGKVVWHDLMTKDKEKAAAFYQELLGWNVESMDMGGGHTYDMIHNQGEGVGGIETLQGGHPHWLAYVSVDDVDAACGRAEANGGKVVAPARDIPNVGRFAVIADPTGGMIAPYQSANPDAQGPEHDVPPDGHFCWEEMLTTDPAKAASFYSEVFGWKAEQMDMGPAGSYMVFKQGDAMVAGTMQMPPEAEAPPHWLSYVKVDDVDAKTAKAKELGGTNYCPPTDIPNIGRFSVCADPTGGMFALFKHAEAPG